jgi:hypothetical protein
MPVLLRLLSSLALALFTACHYIPLQKLGTGIPYSLSVCPLLLSSVLAGVVQQGLAGLCSSCPALDTSSSHAMVVPHVLMRVSCEYPLGFAYVSVDQSEGSLHTITSAALSLCCCRHLSP